jgi:hypothetical protein
MNKTATDNNSTILKFSLLASAFLFLTLIAWSFSGPLVSGYDSTFHMSNIWCARGARPGICENISTINEVTRADVPAVLASESKNKMFNAELSDTSRKSPFYSIMNLFVSKNATESVILIRMFNSFLASLIFFALLYFGNFKSRVAVISSWTFTITPIIVSTLWQLNPRSWGYLSVMSSWALLYIALNDGESKKFRKICLWTAFVFSVLLAFTSRMDASFFCIFTCGIVLLIHLLSNNFLKTKTVGMVAIISLPAFLLLRIFSSSVQWYTQFSFNSIFSNRQTLFVLVHLPENIAHSLGLGLRYTELGPNSLGIFGIVLFSISISSWLKEGNAIQMTATTAIFAFMLLSMFQIAFYWPEANQASGVYVAALLTVCLGVASVYSHKQIYFPSTMNQKAIVILLISACHALTLYSKFDWSVRASVANDSYTKLSLNGGWWWNSPIGPNIVFLVGAIAFPAWLVVSWSVVPQTPTEVSS